MENHEWEALRNKMYAQAKDRQVQAQAQETDSCEKVCDVDVSGKLGNPRSYLAHYIGTKSVRAEPQAKDGRHGYRVIYPDGYESWSPKDVFEASYHPLDNMNFGQAIECLKNGYPVQRRGWNGPGQFLEIQRPGKHSFMSLPYIFITTVSGDRVPWLASQTDMLAEDWRVC